MASSEASRRRHRSRRSKPNHNCTAPTSHAHGTSHMSAEKSRPTWLPPPDGDKENLVQGWLDGIEARRSVTIDVRPAHSQRVHPKYRSKPQSAQYSPEMRVPHALPLLPDTGNAGTASGPASIGRIYQRRRHTLEDHRPIIIPEDGHDEPASPLDLSPTHSTRWHTPLADESYHERGKKRQYTSLGDSLSPRAPSPAAHSFEKRSRHKTRTDRYDVAKHVKEDMARKRRMSETHEAESKRNKKKIKQRNMTSSREVMGKFVSNSILNDRITVRLYPSISFIVLC